MLNKANPEQLKAIMRHQVLRLWEDPSQAHSIAPVFAHGAPGTGKSTSIQELCTELQCTFYDVRASQYDPTDFRGLPVAQDGLMRWLPSSEFPLHAGERAILLFDELTSADRAVQAAIYQIVLDRKVGNRPLPDGVFVCAAGNRSGDRAICQPLSSALANRFLHVEVEPDFEQWSRWWQARGLSPEVLAFLRYRPERFISLDGDLQRGWPSPRSWERVSHTLATGAGLPESVLAIMIEGLVGEAAAVEFAAFRQEWHELPDAVDLLLGKTPFRLPGRADLRYALSSALAWHLWRAPGDLQVRIGHFLRIGMKLSSDFASMAMMDATRSVPGGPGGDMLKALFSHPRYADWVERHGEVLAEAAA